MKNKIKENKNNITESFNKAEIVPFDPRDSTIHVHMDIYNESDVDFKDSLNKRTFNAKYFAHAVMKGCDYKGKPSTEIRGGNCSITLYQVLEDEETLNWVLSPTQKRNILIRFTTSSQEECRLKIYLINATCVGYSSKVDEFAGGESSMRIFAEEIKFNDQIPYKMY